MERAKILRRLMEEQGLKVSDIVKRSGIAYSTVKSILENGIEKTSYVNVCKICEALGITTDQLEQMARSEMETKKEPSYNDVERLIARNGKQMSKEQKLRLIQLLSEIVE
ncbi:helix-turn-helix domain-containing protein [Blautia producta]|uniref:helix-turn-helix domain-containing protein n=1 Tax=Blautia producta TaxID=33035 RepID=UPI002109F71E|nr:helix-turn-helix transcriptional regulator [Blautia producta]MCQ5127607.1 helix-turn-helix domain-containing protein [Blautia producta]